MRTVISALLLALFPALTAQHRANGAAVPLSQFAGASADRQLAAAAQAAVTRGATGVTYVVDTPAVFAAPVDLPAGSTLLFQASATFHDGAFLHALGSTHVLCASGATLHSATRGARLVHATGSNFEMDHCSVSGAGGESFAVETAQASHVRIHDLTLTQIGAAAIVGGDDHVVTNLAMTDPVPHATSYGVTIAGDATHVQVKSVRSTNIANPVEWFNADGDQNKGGPTTREQVLKHGGWYNVSDVQCRNAQACVWGSVAHDLVISDSSAENTGDVAFDCESCVHVLFQRVRSVNSGSGGGAVFFFSDDVRFIHSDFSDSNGHPLFSVHNSTGDKAFNSGLSITENKFTCLKVVCPALVSESAQREEFRGNVLRDATIDVASAAVFGADQIIADNDLVFTLASPERRVNAIRPLNLQGGTLQIARNVVRGTAAFAADSTCIFVYGSDFNTVSTAAITANTCAAAGFSRDVYAQTDGGNNGTGIHWKLTGNTFTHHNVQHRRTAAAFEDWQESGTR